jgi:hypothetical protein
MAEEERGRKEGGDRKVGRKRYGRGAGREAEGGEGMAPTRRRVGEGSGVVSSGVLLLLLCVCVCFVSVIVLCVC